MTTTRPPSTPTPTPTPILTLPSPRNNITIRLFQPTDNNSITHHANNPNIARNLTSYFPNPYTLADAEWWCDFTTNPKEWLPTLSPPSPLSPREDSITSATATVTTTQTSDGKTPANDVVPVAAAPAKYAICHNNLAVGAIGLNYIPSSPSTTKNTTSSSSVRVNDSHTLSLEYWLSEAFWGQGIMTEVVKSFVAWVFETFRWVERVEGCAVEENVVSRRVLAKAGFVEEGLRRSGRSVEGREEQQRGGLVVFGFSRAQLLG